MRSRKATRFDTRVSPDAGKLGFSLLELITALFVLTVGLLGSIHLYFRGIEAMNTVREAALVSSAIRNEVETLRAQPFAALQNGANRPFVSSTPGIDRLPNLHAAVSIEDAFEPSKRIKKITVDAAWSGEHGRTVHRTATTLVADKEGP
ncbi:MAG: hypothetical protein HZB26_09885 [Candidatus Hydrogenedentes bacterium]|nr:hypothetical protein [Candidatus Hydrogenedentota bacterium]